MPAMFRWPAFETLFLRLLLLTLVGLTAGCGTTKTTGVAPSSAALSSSRANAGHSNVPADDGIHAAPPLPLWRVHNATATVYLLGSVHVATADVYPLDARIERAFSESQTLALEVVMDDANKLEASEKLLRAATYPASDSLDQHISATTLALLKTRLEAANIPWPAMRPFRPWFVAMTLTMVELTRLGFDPELGIDEHFRQKAGARELVGIETIDDQVGLFSSMSDQAQEQDLKENLEQFSELDVSMRTAVALWRAGDMEALASLLIEPVRQQYTELFQKVFLERNLKMCAAVEQLLARPGKHFVVVGAGHLVGKGSVVDVLASRGHEMQQFGAAHKPSSVPH